MKNNLFLSIFALIIFITGAKATDITGSVTSNTIWTAANNPYVIVNSIEVNSGVTLTIEPGVIVKFNSGRYLHVRGTLNANGVTFTGNAGVTKGFWDGIYVSYEYYEVGNVNLNNCTVEYASNLYVRKGQLTLHKCAVNNLSGSVRISYLGTLNIDSTQISNSDFPIQFYGAGVVNPGKNLVFTDNTYNYIDIDFERISQEFHLKNFGYPYFNDNNIDVNANATLIMDPGVNLQMNGTDIEVYEGKVKALGTKANPIIFDKYSKGSYWRGIRFYDGSIDSACIMKNCVLKNAAYDYEWYAALRTTNASPIIDSCRFTGNAWNLHIEGTSNPLISNCVFGPSTVVNGEAYNLTMDMNANPTFTNDSIQFNDRELKAIRLRGTTIVNEGHLKKISFIGLNNISYCLYDNTIVHDTASLVIDPGVVIKCRDGYSMITANGTLTGIGTTTEPIIFTHIADDTYGNPADSQNDGTQAPATSAGGRICLYSSTLSKIENWKFNYAGNYSSNWAIYLKNSNIVNKCEIKNSYNAIWFTKNAQITNNSFINIAQYPIGYNLSNGSPNIQGNTLTNVGFTGIQLDGVETDSPTLKKMDFAGYTNLPYILTHSITIENGNTLTINPGIIIKSNRFGQNWIINGALKAIGTKTEKIIFTSINDDSVGGDTNNNTTSTIPNNYDWYGFNFTGSASDTENIMRNCEIRYCGGGWNIDCPIQITDCHVLLDSVKINFTNQCGLAIFGNADPEIKDCEFSNIAWEPIYMDMFANPTFTGTNKLSNVADIAIKLRSGTVNGTVPARSFAGYNPITYLWYDDALTVTDELTIPAGLTFKGHGRWNIKGKLNIKGTATNPVVFTTVEDDMYGYPKDSQQDGALSPTNNGNFFVFYDSANDSSTIDHAIFRYSNTTPIQLNNASPFITNCTFENYPNCGISLAGLSAPTIENCTFNNISYPFTTSLLTYPRFTAGNTISGSTGRAIRVNDETLTQDATLMKRSFAGITNIPYVFNYYTVGSSAKLTIEPGIIAKFMNYGYLNVSNGLIAVGGSTSDSAIVFTSDRDDFYGGDTYNNADANAPWSYAWRGIYFYNESVDENCVLKNCIIKYASYPDSRGAVTVDNASPTIQNCRFDKGYHGIIATNSSFPVITDCDFIDVDDNYGYAIWNKSLSTTVTATNCWYNATTGPKNATSNPLGTGERISDYVAFSPFTSQLTKAELGDVSQNGTINPYDASLILQYVVSNIVLNPAQQNVADVSKNGSITSYDASMILQYNVNLIATFTPNPSMIRKLAPTNIQTGIALTTVQPATNAGEFIIPITLNTGAGVKSLDLKFNFNQQHIKLINVRTSKLNQDISFAQSTQTDNGILAISMASAQDLSLENGIIYLTFKLMDVAIAESEFNITSAMANESQLTLNNSTIPITSKIITFLSPIEANKTMKIWIGGDKLNIEFYVQTQLKKMNINIINTSGRTLVNCNYNKISEGKQILQIPLSDLGNLQNGVYLVRINADGRNFSEKMVLNRK